MKRKFYIFGILLTLTVALGLIVQYSHLSKIINKDKELNINMAREHLGHQINSNIKYHSQFTVAASEFLATDKWTDDEVVEFFNGLIGNNPSIKSIYFGDPSNKLIISYDWTPPSTYDLRKRQWYIKAIEEDGIIVSDVYIDAIDNKPVVAISKPVYDREGRFLGVIGSDISVEEIIKMVEVTTIKGLGYSFLIDGAGNLIAHPKYSFQSEEDIVNIDSIGSNIHKELTNSKSGQIQVELDGVKGYLSYEPLEETDWIIGNFMSIDEFMGNRWNVWNMFFTTFIIAIFIFGTFTYLQRENFLLPVSKLDEDIRKINIEENIGYRVPLDKKDPFLELRNSINMVLNKTKEFFEQTEQDAEEIMAQNEELEASYSELSAMEEELRDQYDQIIASEEGLRKALEKNNAIMAAIPDILFVFDKEGRFVDVQAPDEEDLFISKEEFLGRKIDEVFSFEMAQMTYERIKNVLNNNVMESYEYELQMPRGLQNYEVRMVRLNKNQALAITRNNTNKKVLERELITLSYNDQLTGLYNRRFFEEELKRLDIEENLPLTIVMADVNGLKLINDSFGHKAGDELLKNIAKIIKKGCRTDDIISRISGDEFVIILPKTAEEEAERLIKRLKKLSIEENSLNENLINMELSISFGVGTKYSMDMDMAQVFKKAEDNMYAHKLLEGPSMRSKTIETIIKALYEKNQREEQHSNRVSLICQDIGVALNMTEERLRELESVGLLHDIGKIAINEAILDKPGYLTEEEWEEMKKHPEIGYRILSTVNEMSQIAEYVLYHHERYDGLGYPKGLKGEEIPLISRIITIADAYDAMAADRPYRKALSNEEIVKEFIKNSGTQFDPKLSRIFVENVLGCEWIEE